MGTWQHAAAIKDAVADDARPADDRMVDELRGQVQQSQLEQGQPLPLAVVAAVAEEGERAPSPLVQRHNYLPGQGQELVLPVVAEAVVVAELKPCWD